MKAAHDLVTAAKERAHEISLDESEQAIRDADILLDVRDPEEYSAGHIPGAVNISRGLLEFKLSGSPDPSGLSATQLFIISRLRCMLRSQTIRTENPGAPAR